jgi:hypothetical protein
MTALDLPERGLRAARRLGVDSVGGRWSLAAGGTAQVRARGSGRVLQILLRREEARLLPLVSGALNVRDPVHLTIGEVAVAVDKTQSVRLTLAELTALGNRRYAADVIACELGDEAGPDETLRLEGYADRRGGSLRLVLSGPAPTCLGGAGWRIRLAASFDR